MKTKPFDELMKKKLTSEEICCIEKEAIKEAKLLKFCFECGIKLNKRNLGVHIERGDTGITEAHCKSCTQNSLLIEMCNKLQNIEALLKDKVKL